MISGVVNKGAIFLVRKIGRVNRPAVMSRNKTDMSHGGEVNNKEKRMTDISKE